MVKKLFGSIFTWKEPLNNSVSLKCNDMIFMIETVKDKLLKAVLILYHQICDEHAWMFATWTLYSMIQLFVFLIYRLLLKNKRWNYFPPKKKKIGSYSFCISELSQNKAKIIQHTINVKFTMSGIQAKLWGIKETKIYIVKTK